MEIEITAMNRIQHPTPNKGGDVIVANFDAKVGPFILSHCALVRLYKGDQSKGLTVFFPNVMAPHGRRGIRCGDKEVALAVKDAAAKVFSALGGGMWKGVHSEGVAFPDPTRAR